MDQQNNKDDFNPAEQEANNDSIEEGEESPLDNMPLEDPRSERSEVTVSAEVLEDGYRYRLEPIGVTLQFIQNKDGETIPGITHELLIHVMIHRLKVLNEKHSCRENSIAITKLQETLHWFYARQDRRTQEEIDKAIAASGGEAVNEVIGTDSIPVFSEDNAGQ